MDNQQLISLIKNCEATICRLKSEINTQTISLETYKNELNCRVEMGDPLEDAIRGFYFTQNRADELKDLIQSRVRVPW